MPSQWDAEALFRFVDVMGVVANGLLGGAVARSKRFDIVGFATLAIISGLGGGMIRDVLLGAGYPRSRWWTRPTCPARSSPRSWPT